MRKSRVSGGIGLFSRLSLLYRKSEERFAFPPSSINNPLFVEVGKVHT